MQLEVGDSYNYRDDGYIVHFKINEIVTGSVKFQAKYYQNDICVLVEYHEVDVEYFIKYWVNPEATEYSKVTYRKNKLRRIIND